MKHNPAKVLYAAAVCDAAGVDARGGAVLVQGGRVVAAGPVQSLPQDLLGQAEAVHMPEHLVLPAMVNAHTHLELTGVGPQAYDPAGGFTGWVQMLRRHWPDDPGFGVLADDAWFVRGAEQGLELLQQSGVQAAGDVSRFLTVADALRASPLEGETYLEMFGLGEPFHTRGLEMLAGHPEIALQPHAPYSAGPALFDAAARSGRRVSCHLAETLDEHDFVARLQGPMLDMLRMAGKWDDAFASYYGQGLSPVQWMRPHLQAAADDGGWLVAHCNYVSDEDIQVLAQTNASVAYCPLASEYFGHRDHRYRDMLAAGVNVCLGTDSIVGTDPDDPQPLGLLSAMRRLYQRDKTDPAVLLAMATLHGARALRLDPAVATLRPGAPARFACLRIDPQSPKPPMQQILLGQMGVERVWFE